MRGEGNWKRPWLQPLGSHTIIASHAATSGKPDILWACKDILMLGRPAVGCDILQIVYSDRSLEPAATAVWSHAHSRAVLHASYTQHAGPVPRITLPVSRSTRRAEKKKILSLPVRMVLSPRSPPGKRLPFKTFERWYLLIWNNSLPCRWRRRKCGLLAYSTHQRASI